MLQQPAEAFNGRGGIKEINQERFKSIRANENINKTKNGSPYLGAALDLKDQENDQNVGQRALYDE